MFAFVLLNMDRVKIPIFLQEEEEKTEEPEEEEEDYVPVYSQERCVCDERIHERVGQLGRCVCGERVHEWLGQLGRCVCVVNAYMSGWGIWGGVCLVNANTGAGVSCFDKEKWAKLQLEDLKSGGVVAQRF